MSAGRPRSTRRALPGVVRSIRRLAARRSAPKVSLRHLRRLEQSLQADVERSSALVAAVLDGGRSGRSQGDAVAAAFLEAVTPAGVRACTEAVGELERQHEQRLAGQRLAVERAQFEADRAQRQFDACEPENRLVGRTLERAGSRRCARSSQSDTSSPSSRPAAPSRSPTPSARRSPGSRATCRDCGKRRRPRRATAKSCCAR